MVIRVTISDALYSLRNRLIYFQLTNHLIAYLKPIRVQIKTYMFVSTTSICMQKVCYMQAILAQLMVKKQIKIKIKVGFYKELS